MALIVETGAIIAGADSYVSVTNCDTYHAARGNAAWTGMDAVKEAALRKAAAYLDGHYRNRWKGRKVEPTIQDLEWPRYDVCVSEAGPFFLDSDVIPRRVKDAQCELALIALSADLAPSVAAGIKREKIDVLETEYFAGVPVGTTVYTAVNNLLSDFITPKQSRDAVRG